MVWEPGSKRILDGKILGRKMEDREILMRTIGEGKTEEMEDGPGRIPRLLRTTAKWGGLLLFAGLGNQRTGNWHGRK